jgi:uncharacterized membrane protein
MTFLIAFASPFAANAEERPTTLITIDSNGVVQVNVTAPIEPGVCWLKCPVEPIPATIIVSVDGGVIPAIYHNNSVVIVSDRSGHVTMNYIANATLEGGEMRFWYGSAEEATLVVPPNVILTSLPEGIVRAYLDNDGRLHIVFKGPCSISFVVGERGRPQAQAPATPGQAPVTPTTPLSSFLPYVIVALVVIVAGALAYKVARRKRGSPPLAEYLDEVDKEILERIKEHGGEVVQSVLYRELQIPKATLWRHVRRLERLGYVAVERMGRDNKVRLLK